MRFPFRTLFSQVFALVLACIVATLALGFTVLALSPPPPPPTVSIASFVQAYKRGSKDELSLKTLGTPPPAWRRSTGQAETLIGASLASGLGLAPSSVRVTITAPSLYGLLPRSGEAERGQMTIIDVPASLGIGRSDAPFDINTYLRNPAVRVPPFIAVVRQPDGRFLQLQPRERPPTEWQLRLLTIFALSFCAVAPLAWLGARRWTDSIRRLSARVNRFDIDAGLPVATAGAAEEVRILEQAFDALDGRLRAQMKERLQMLMAVAHDLRTPLTSLRIRSEDVRDDLKAGFIRDLGRLEQMIEDILAFARAQRPRKHEELVDFAGLVTELVGEARARGDSVVLQAEPALVRGDTTELSRAVDNLLRNAGRYATSAVVALTNSAGRATLTVRDNGPGVPEQLLPRLTEPFFRVEQSRNVDTGGIGLGLATVQAIVDAHAGTLTFANTDGGFEVELSLPAIPASDFSRR